MQQYSGMAGVLLLMHSDLSAQAIYTDIDPDIVLQFDDETTGVDMDNDGDFDFAFFKLSYYWTSTFSTCLLYTSPSPRDRTRSRMPSSA